MLEDAAYVKQTEQGTIEMLLALAMIVSLQPDDVQPNCSGNTLEINACLGEKRDRSEKRLQNYVRAAIDRHIDQDGKSDSVALGIQASQTAFEAYRAIECAAVYERWKEGTIRGAMGSSCATELTDQRTRTVWENWLRYMDSTPPILPEPKPTE